MPKIATALTALTLLFVADNAAAHCQVPCGIYDDEARISEMMEDVATIDKAVKSILELSQKGDALSLNQATRWINNKEIHASNIIEIVSLYFLTQKVKAPAVGDAAAAEAYMKKLADHHGVMSAAMKTKQTVDMQSVEALRAAVKQLGHHYMATGDAHAHSQPQTRGH